MGKLLVFRTIEVQVISRQPLGFLLRMPQGLLSTRSIRSSTFSTGVVSGTMCGSSLESQ